MVDDNLDNLDLFGTFFRLKGHSVRTAANGPEALSLIEDFRPEIIFLDLSMPGMDGYEVCARLRENEAAKHAHIYAVTGLPNMAHPKLFDGHLLKPVKLELLLNLVTTCRPGELGSPEPDRRADRTSLSAFGNTAQATAAPE